jgi:hypothetical protein
VSGLTKKHRKMPRHIVLPNGQWRFISGKSRRVHKSMARRGRKAYSRHRSSGLGGGKLMRGLFPVSGMIAGALIGAGAATMQEKFLPQVIPYQGAAAGFAVAGIAGAGGALLRDMFKGTTTAQNAVINY